MSESLIQKDIEGGRLTKTPYTILSTSSSLASMPLASLFVLLCMTYFLPVLLRRTLKPSKRTESILLFQSGVDVVVVLRRVTHRNVMARSCV